MSSLLPIIYVRSKGGWYWNTWSWVFKNSLAIAREDATKALTEPSRIYMSGPYCLAKFANFMCGAFPKINKLPTIGHGHGPRGNWWEVLNQNVWTRATKSINNRSMIKNTAFSSNNIPNCCTSWNIDTSILLLLLSTTCTTCIAYCKYVLQKGNIST